MSLRGSTGAIRGWGCTPTGDPPAAAVTTEEPSKSFLPAIFTRGWRRNALYGILVCLMVLVFLNIALTLWIISALRLSMVSLFFENENMEHSDQLSTVRRIEWKSHGYIFGTRLTSPHFF